MIIMYVLLFLLINRISSFYVPLATSLSVSKTAKSIKLADSTVVISRNSTGHPIGFHDYCPHRGASFDKVVLKDDNINCPYHGFVFNTQDGELESGLGVRTGCGHLKMIDCIERSGLVWGCIDGVNDIKPPQELKEKSDPKFRKISGSVMIKCPVENLIENILDSLHISHVHSFGNRIEPEPLNYNASKVSETSGVSTFQYNTGETSMFNGVADVKNWYEIPCTSGTRVSSGNNVKIVQVHAVQFPGGYTKVFWELYRNWSTEHYMDSFFEMAMMITLNEDSEILEKCNFDKGNKFHGRYDKLQLLYRRSLGKHKVIDVRNSQ